SICLSVMEIPPDFFMRAHLYAPNKFGSYRAKKERRLDMNFSLFSSSVLVKIRYAHVKDKS
ncbi:hypothetical protein ACQUD9_13985, partial [Vagococcus fluvialis]|uniref:hypothetical protein n=1 Tax=Vagococcus fluvialis TaxID=2738 RepID=UPI003D1254F8